MLNEDCKLQPILKVIPFSRVNRRLADRNVIRVNPRVTSRLTGALVNLIAALVTLAWMITLRLAHLRLALSQFPPLPLSTIFVTLCWQLDNNSKETQIKSLGFISTFYLLCNIFQNKISGHIFSFTFAKINDFFFIDGRVVHIKKEDD